MKTALKQGLNAALLIMLTLSPIVYLAHTGRCLRHHPLHIKAAHKAIAHLLESKFRRPFEFYPVVRGKCHCIHCVLWEEQQIPLQSHAIDDSKLVPSRS
jgi:hypothetical protein